MAEEKLVVVRAAGWNYDLDGQPGYEFFRAIDRSRDAHGRSSGWQLENGSPVGNQVAYAYGADRRLSSVTGSAGVPPVFSDSDLPNSSLISSVTGPGHTVTNTWAADRDVPCWRKKTKV